MSDCIADGKALGVFEGDMVGISDGDDDGSTLGKLLG